MYILVRRCRERLHGLRSAAWSRNPFRPAAPAPGCEPDREPDQEPPRLAPAPNGPDTPWPQLPGIGQDRTTAGWPCLLLARDLLPPINPVTYLELRPLLRIDALGRVRPPRIVGPTWRAPATMLLPVPRNPNRLRGSWNCSSRTSPDGCGSANFSPASVFHLHGLAEVPGTPVTPLGAPWRPVVGKETP